MRSRKRTQGIHIGMSREREKRERDRQGRGVRRQAGGANRLWGGEQRESRWQRKERDVDSCVTYPRCTYGTAVSAANVRFLFTRQPLVVLECSACVDLHHDLHVPKRNNAGRGVDYSNE